MSHPGKTRLSVDTLQRIHRARNRGHCSQTTSWQFESYDPNDPAVLVDFVVEWCKQALSECRRPYGVGHFDVGFSYVFGEDRKQGSWQFPRLEPIQLYDGSFAASLSKTFGRPGGEPFSLTLNATFFSWGDALHLVLEQRAKATV